jgi:hypothetical protein
VAGRDLVVIQDTTELNLGGRPARANGYGPIGKGGAVRGLVLHVGLVVDRATGAVIGLVDGQVWNRDKGALTHRHSRRTAEKESQRWLDGAARAGEALAGANSITEVSDRESDIFEHFARRPSNVELLVRARHDRRIEIDPDNSGELLYRFVDDLPEAGRFTLNIPAARDAGRGLRNWRYALRR